MTARVLRPAITFTTVVAVLLAALAVYAFLSAGDTQADSTYKPGTTVRFCNGLDPLFAGTDSDLDGSLTCEVSPGENLAVGATQHPDITTSLDMVDGDLNFSNVVTMNPPAITLSAVPVGTKVGGLRSLSTLGLFNNPCAQPVTVDFVLWNVALPSNAGDPRASTNIVWPKAPGSSDRFGRWKGSGAANSGVHTSNPPATTDGEWATDAPPTGSVVTPIVGHPNNGAGTSLSIANYPGYLLDAFDPDFYPGVGDNPPGDPRGAGDEKPRVPFAVYGGLTKVSTDWVALYFLQFNAGDLAAAPAMAAPLGEITTVMGAPSVSYLNDATAVQASPSSITDFCTPLAVTTMLLGAPVGGDRATTSTAGTAFFIQYNASQRDSDQDGWENSIDTCPVNPTIPPSPTSPVMTPIKEDPRDGGVALPPHPTTDAHDADTDGIKDSCDANAQVPAISQTPPPTPGPGTPTYAPTATPPTATVAPAGADVDSDGFQNRQDLCPQLFNPLQVEGELGAAAPDKGPRTDSLGGSSGPLPRWDVSCDNGTLGVIQNGHPITLTFGNEVGNGRYMSATNVVAKCLGSTDLDAPSGDGYCTAQDGAETGLCAGTVPPSCLVRHNSWTATSSMLCKASVTGCATATQDTDGDGSIGIGSPVSLFPWTDAAETYLGTDPTKPCAQTGTANDEWPGIGTQNANYPFTQTTAGSYIGYDAWPLDFNDDQLVNGSDYGAWSFVLAGGSKPVNAAVPAGVRYNSLIRYDLNFDGIITGGDLQKLGSMFGIAKKCGTAAAPWTPPPLILGTTFQQ